MERIQLPRIQRNLCTEYLYSICMYLHVSLITGGSRKMRWGTGAMLIGEMLSILLAGVWRLEGLKKNVHNSSSRKVISDGFDVRFLESTWLLNNNGYKVSRDLGLIKFSHFYLFIYLFRKSKYIARIWDIAKTNNNLTFYSSPLQSIRTICLSLVLTKASTSSEMSTGRGYLQEPNHSDNKLFSPTGVYTMYHFYSSSYYY